MTHGLTNEALLFTVDEIRQFPAVSRIHFIECSGNSLIFATMGQNCG
ncbi:hypothetical protein [Pseudomonas qingdaonensis]